MVMATNAFGPLFRMEGQAYVRQIPAVEQGSRMSHFEYLIAITFWITGLFNGWVVWGWKIAPNKKEPA